LIFSAEAFPGHQIQLDWRRADGSGNWYFSPALIWKVGSVRRS
jgi:hypothetical protein